MNAAPPEISVVKDVMTTRVIWVRKDASFKELAAALRAQRVSAFPVLDEAGRLAGRENVLFVARSRNPMR